MSDCFGGCFTDIENKLDNLPISRNQFLEIAEEAAELKPRLVFENITEKHELNDRFISEIKKQINTSGRWSNNSILVAFGLVFIMIIIILVVFMYPIYIKYKELNDVYLEYLKVELFMPAFWLRVYCLLGDAVIIITIVILFLTLWHFIQKKFKLLIYRILFRRDIFKGVFLQLDYLDLVKKHKKSTKQMAILALLFIVSVLTILIIEGFEGIKHLKFPIMLLLLSLTGLLYFNTYKFYNQIKKLNKSVKEIYQRIQFASQIEVLTSITLLILAINFIFPKALDAVQFFEHEIVIKASQRQYLEAIQKIDFTELNPEITKNVKESVKDIFTITPSLNISDGGIENLKMILNEFPDFTITVTWIIILALILSFSIPYFHFLGLRSGFTFLLVIGISIITNVVVERKFSSWFFVENSQIMRYLVILIFSFWFSILFDWLLKVLSFNKQECPNCRNLVESHFNFCPNCGLIKNQL